MSPNDKYTSRNWIRTARFKADVVLGIARPARGMHSVLTVWLHKRLLFENLLKNSAVVKGRTPIALRARPEWLVAI
eukprot:4460880-Pyramimonas_sp.AAC.1